MTISYPRLKYYGIKEEKMELNLTVEQLREELEKKETEEKLKELEQEAAEKAQKAKDVPPVQPKRHKMKKRPKPQPEPTPEPIPAAPQQDEEPAVIGETILNESNEELKVVLNAVWINTIFNFGIFMVCGIIVFISLLDIVAYQVLAVLVWLFMCSIWYWQMNKRISPRNIH